MRFTDNDDHFNVCCSSPGAACKQFFSHIDIALYIIHIWLKNIPPNRSKTKKQKNHSHLALLMLFSRNCCLAQNIVYKMMESQHTEQIPSVFQHALYDDLVAAWNLSRFVILVCRWMSCTSHTAQNKQQTHITYMPHSRTHHRPYRIPNFTAIRPGKCVCVCVRIVDHRIPHHLKGAECNAKCTNLTTHFVKCTFNIYFYTTTYCIVGNNMVGHNIFVMYQKSRNF